MSVYVRLLCVRDLDLPTSPLELVVDEARPVHRLDRRPNRQAMTIEPYRQSAQTVDIRRGRTCEQWDDDSPCTS
jgi:hypothetical protein